DLGICQAAFAVAGLVGIVAELVEQIKHHARLDRQVIVLEPGFIELEQTEPGLAVGVLQLAGELPPPLTDWHFDPVVAPLPSSDAVKRSGAVAPCRAVRADRDTRVLLDAIVLWLQDRRPH